MPIPVITALGHTSDRTVADMVADREARTPTAAAELVVPKKADLLRQLQERGDRLRRAGSVALLPKAHELARRREQLRRLALLVTAARRESVERQRIRLRAREPHRVLVQRERALHECRARLERVVRNLLAFTRERQTRIERINLDLQGAVRRRLDNESKAVEERARRLRTLGPQETLERGYSICIDTQQDRVLRESSETATGSPVRVILAKGKLECTVEAVDA
jgi:exodeoxyribonuclease VII large subunit